MPLQRLVTGVMTGLVTMRSDPDGWLKALIQRRAWARDKDLRRRDKAQVRAPTGGCASALVVRWSFRLFCQILKKFSNFGTSRDCFRKHRGLRLIISNCGVYAALDRTNQFFNLVQLME